MAVVEKGAIAINRRVFALVEHGGDILLLKQRMQLCAGAVLHAVIRPEGLRQPVELTLRVGLGLVLAGEAAVVCRMPVLAGNHDFAARQAPVDQPVGDINGAIALRHGERAARAKIICKSTSSSARLVIISSLLIGSQLAAQVFLHQAANGLNVQILAQQVVQLGQRRLDGHIETADHARLGGALPVA